MTQLSPLMWLILSPLIILILIALATITWWNQMPIFNIPQNNKPVSMFSNWSW